MRLNIPRRLPPWQSLIGLGASVGLGLLASWAHVPLAWVLGPLIATALVSIAGFPVFAPALGRRLGQAVAGTSVGLNVTAAALQTITLWAPLMVLTALLAIFLSAVLSVPLARVGRIDHKTAFFSLTPGGLSEMANVGVSVGAQPELIALSQALRVALLVCLMPPVIIGLGIDGGLINEASQVRLSWPQAGIALMAGIAGVAVTRMLRFNNPWTVGAIVGAACLAASDILIGRMPGVLFSLGQFFIGISIGSRFRRENIVRLPRLALISSIFTILLAALLFGYAGLLSVFTDIDIASAALASSPGGMAEMALTAQVLHLNVALVTAFHVIRAFLVNAFTLHFYGLFKRIGLFAMLEAIFGRTKSS
ncbi:AbrB family transcriptional regulator [Microvirga roseola]|uniref:AbrB family transcriptional regulator n=1 Tax=Microvirga roseola TaxID=2883126 RepID=UPI001E379183|nr:AbrB family transcriptional regulator [Microvirga roseola]